MRALELKSVRKSYDGVVAVDNLSLAIPQGCIYGLLGPNGAGKTTALRMMTGILMPDEGAVCIFGEPFERRHLKTIGYLPEERGLYRKAKVSELLLYLGELKGLSRAIIQRRIVELAERFDISAALTRRIEELSKGMEQKIQLITAMINDPQLLILDEPFTGLDPLNSALLVELLLELKRAGRTILFSSHRMDRVEKLCDEICLLGHGTNILQGAVPELKERFGGHQVRLVYRGEAPLLGHNGSIESHINGGNTVELRIGPEANAQELLRTVAASATIVSYETVEPSLEEIFIAAAGTDHGI
ncbi:MAG: ATP-binding cassette domain-containing protein [Deltaproteobacteria bacterium]|nr:ATP-binding cassette domain-containing protein [Deltaproteobacteria bacterium]